jgi:hypothetical protein
MGVNSVIDNLDKFEQAIKTLKSTAQWSINYSESETTINEALFNKIDWITGKDSDDTATTTTTNPHSEITWTKVKAEMDKL